MVGTTLHALSLVILLVLNGYLHEKLVNYGWVGIEGLSAIHCWEGGLAILNLVLFMAPLQGVNQAWCKPVLFHKTFSIFIEID